MNTYKMYIIETLSNMHVGSGDTHFGIVDNLIQRNPVTNIPVIHASGIKGSIREYFDHLLKYNNSNTNLEKDEVIELFGSEVEGGPETPDALKNSPGHLIFFEANMLTLPLRSNQNVFYNCTSEAIIIDYLNMFEDFIRKVPEFNDLKAFLKTMNFRNHDFYYFNDVDDLEIEDYTKGMKYKSQIPDSVKKAFNTYLNIDINNLAIFDSSLFSRICKDSIPVVARNYIKEDGTSGNLFYEEVLPRKTTLYFLLGYDSYLNQNSKKNLKDKFEKEFNNNGKVYQFGANYSIGYGFSKIVKVIE
ncbi:type III-B CRISPR module RAMP protein Cmr4 [Rosettibacter firmus]|uniref:type III-B CRISPR module RAMP protein Cmr4 n=1 Tax=Rosettibacter firmus TaxID=3111522 RepID=UPI00336BE837